MRYCKYCPNPLGPRVRHHQSVVLLLLEPLTATHLPLIDGHLIQAARSRGTSETISQTGERCHERVDTVLHEPKH
ncbi:hypothetical protein PM082_015074 [Marasmius tenuissimus]|nr:hypothetical protein PM082_015074 [Marasmius tenuissimus]